MGPVRPDDTHTQPLTKLASHLPIDGVQGPPYSGRVRRCCCCTYLMCMRRGCRCGALGMMIKITTMSDPRDESSFCFLTDLVVTRPPLLLLPMLFCFAPLPFLSHNKSI